MEQKIMLWQGIALSGIAAATTIILFVLKSAIKIRQEVKKFLELKRTDSVSTALKNTRISKADAKRMKLTGAD